MTLYSTIWRDEKPFFPEDVIELPRSRMGVWGVFKVVRSLKAGDSILLNGAMGREALWIDMLFGVYIAFRKRDVGVLISDATWHARTVSTESKAKVIFGLYQSFLKLLSRLTRSRHTHYCFLSTAEIKVVEHEAKIAGTNLHFTKFCSQLPPEIHDELQECAIESHSGKYGVTICFSGGNSLRDYDTLIAAAHEIDARFLIASSNKHKYDGSKITFEYLDHHEFFRQMARSDLVIVPLLPAPGRSVGQQHLSQRAGTWQTIDRDRRNWS